MLYGGGCLDDGTQYYDDFHAVTSGFPDGVGYEDEIRLYMGLICDKAWNIYGASTVLAAVQAFGTLGVSLGNRENSLINLVGLLAHELVHTCGFVHVKDLDQLYAMEEAFKKELRGRLGWVFVVTFSSVTSIAVAGGTVFLMGTSAPIDSVALDGVPLQQIQTKAQPVDYLTEDQQFSVIVPLPPSIKIGRHELQVTRGADVWHQELDVISQPLRRREEDGGSCGRSARGFGLYLVSVTWAAEVVHVGDRIRFVDISDEGVGLVVRSAAGVRIIAGSRVLAWSEPDASPTGRIVQTIYPDGTVGGRWVLECDTATGQPVPLPGGPGIPLWLAQ